MCWIWAQTRSLVVFFLFLFPPLRLLSSTLSPPRCSLFLDPVFRGNIITRRLCMTTQHNHYVVQIHSWNSFGITLPNVRTELQVLETYSDGGVHSCVCRHFYLCYSIIIRRVNVRRSFAGNGFIRRLERGGLPILMNESTRISLLIIRQPLE